MCVVRALLCLAVRLDTHAVCTVFNGSTTKSTDWLIMRCGVLVAHTGHSADVEWVPGVSVWDTLSAEARHSKHPVHLQRNHVLGLHRCHTHSTSTFHSETQMPAPSQKVPKLHCEAEKRNHFSFMNKSFNMQCNLTKFSTLIVNEYYHWCYLFCFDTVGWVAGRAFGL